MSIELVLIDTPVKYPCSMAFYAAHGLKLEDPFVWRARDTGS
jgi:hypothetical protein